MCSLLVQRGARERQGTPETQAFGPPGVEMWLSYTLDEGFFAALGRFRAGVYVNFLGGDEDPDR